MSGWIDYAEWRGGGPEGTARVRVLPRIDGIVPERHLLAWLPPSYGQGERAYPVVYMHDGQNLFDDATSHAGSWGAGTTLERLAAEGIEVIVVGVPNAGPRRLEEYSPYPDRRYGGGGADRYLEFLAGPVKRRIDADLRTLPSPATTGLAGSSMGGLVSLYGVFARPDAFGLAAALSPSLRFGGDGIFRFVSREARPGARIYLDIGTREVSEGPGRLGAAIRSRRHTRAVRRMRHLLERRGYRPGVDLMHREAIGDTHHESAWGRRLGGALRFLLAGPEAV